MDNSVFGPDLPPFSEGVKPAVTAVGIIEFERVEDTIVIRESEDGEVTDEVEVTCDELARMPTNIHWLGEVALEGGVKAVRVVLQEFRKWI